MKHVLSAIAVATVLGAGAAHADQAMDAGIAAIAKAWDHAQFEMTQKDEKIAAFHRIEEDAESLAKKYPRQAEPMVWDAITISSEAGAVGGLGALGKVTQARDIFEAAEKINAQIARYK